MQIIPIESFVRKTKRPRTTSEKCDILGTYAKEVYSMVNLEQLQIEENYPLEGKGIEAFDEFYKSENKRIMEQYATEIDEVFSYPKCELAPNFLGFLHVYGTVVVPKDFVVIDFGCNQAVQAQYFKDHRKYIGIDNNTPVSARFQQENAEYYGCSIQEFIQDIWPTFGLDNREVFAICSYVPDEGARNMVADSYHFARVVYGDIIVCDRKPPLFNMYNCLRLLQQCRKSGLIAGDPDRKDNLLIYMDNMPEGQPDGFYSRNIFDVAEDLLIDGDGQRFLVNELKAEGVEFMPQEVYCRTP